MTNKNYISESGLVGDDINAFINSKIQGGNMIVMTTEEFLCPTQQKIKDTEHLLEVRVFNDDMELKIMRPTIADDFTYRIIDDSKGEYEYLEERQYLDIDTKRSSGNKYIATGGGKYSLPIEDAERVLIKNYISYDKNGIAQITDFRVVRYLKRGER